MRRLTLRMRVRLSLCVLFAFLFNASARAQGRESVANSHGSEVVATIGGHSIYMRDLEQYWQSKEPTTFTRLQQQMSEARQRLLDGFINEYLLKQEASKRDVTPEQLLGEIDATAARQPVPTDNEISELYTRLGGQARGMTLEQARPSLVAYARLQRVTEARAQFAASLRKQAGDSVSIALQRPRSRVKVAASDPVRGSSAAPVEIVAFSDFECPYCRKVRPVLEEVAARYKDKVRLVFKNFPLPSHPSARGAAEAAVCAHDQGQFWRYHDKLFANSESLAPKDLIQYATELGLNTAQFDLCVRAGTHRAKVSADIEEGKRLGVESTPTVFVNGRMTAGAAPLEVFDRIIREELSAAQLAPGSK